MADVLKRIAVKRFSGMSRRGSRHAFLINELWNRGCRPSIDSHGNIWVEKGKRGKTTLFSSHIDVDPSVHALYFGYKKEKNQKVAYGVIDNAAGCYLNLLLAQEGPKKGRAIYVFTASEEAHRGNIRKYCQSAREILRELRKRSIKPSLCIALDVTHPRLLHKQEKINWEKAHEELFDMEDETHCYVDGYSRRDARRMGIKMVKRFGDVKVAARRFHGHDEAHVYSRLCPAFAFGPVVFGRFDRPNQKMPLSHLRTAMRFLRRMLA